MLTDAFMSADFVQFYLFHLGTSFVKDFFQNDILENQINHLLVDYPKTPKQIRKVPSVLS